MPFHAERRVAKSKKYCLTAQYLQESPSYDMIPCQPNRCPWA